MGPSRDKGRVELTFIDPSPLLYPPEPRSPELRASLGLERSAVRLPSEAEDLHPVVVEEGRDGSCVPLHPEGEHAGRGFRELTPHARAHVAGFHEKLGRERSGEPFVGVGIPPCDMRRRL